ncbi:MAG: hypothetical protein KatS3mg105_4069 [Gemmatales bacterium]|nr:MAG: hypothetical protein KatS3mg105_4069 [Gemmatales bacterium]
MELRVTNQTTISRMISSIRQASDRLAVFQQQAATGKRLLRPSDSPIDVSRVLANRAADQRFEASKSTLQAARSTLQASSSALQEVSAIFIKAREILVSAKPAPTTDRNALAGEVDVLLDRLLHQANAQNEGRFLFAGMATDTQPFVTNASGEIVYQGSDQRTEVPLTRFHNTTPNFSGREVFQARTRGATLYSGTTGAAAGTGTDSVTGQAFLTVSHTATTYAAGSGIQPGASSANGDTVIGPMGSHQLTIVDSSGTGASGTVSLNGGPPVPFTSSDTDLQVTGPNGEIVFVDTTGITPGFNGNVALSASGTLSLDGGTTSIPINFSSNQVVSDPSGNIVNVDSSAIRFAGMDALSFSGTYDAFQLLQSLRDTLNNTMGLSADQQDIALDQLLGEIDRVHDNIRASLGEQGTLLEDLDHLENRLGDLQLTTRETLSHLEDADLTEVLLNLRAQENSLQLALATAARSFEQNLLDFLR